MADVVDGSTRLAIEALIHEQAWLIAHDQADRVVDRYADDARLLGVGAEKSGRDAIGAWAAERAAMTGRRSRHVQSNIRLRPMPGGGVSGTVLLTLYRHDGDGPAPAAPLMVAEYADHYAQVRDGTWRFAERRLTILFGG